MTTLTEPVAARWLTDALPPLVDTGLDHPTVVRGVWIDQTHDETDAQATVWRVTKGAVDRPITLAPDPRGRYRVTCDDGVRRRLTLDQLRGVA